MNTTIPRRGRLAALALATVGLLTGCLQVDTSVSVNEDGSGTATVRFAIDGDAMGMFAMGDEDPCDEIMADADSGSDDLPDGVTAETFNDDGWCGITLTSPFDNPNELGPLLDNLNQSSSGASGGELDATYGGVALTETADGWEFRVDQTNVSEADLGLEGEDDEFGAMFESLFEDFRVQFEVTLPGKILDHNADEVSGSTATWTLQVGDERSSLFAESDKSGVSSGGSGSSLIWIIVGILVVAGIGLVVWAVLRGRGKGDGEGGEGIPATQPHAPLPPQPGTPQAPSDHPAPPVSAPPASPLPPVTPAPPTGTPPAPPSKPDGGTPPPPPPQA